MEPGRRPLVLFALGAIALAVEVAWLAPAALLDSRVAAATRGALRLTGTEGTFWQGRGVIAAANARVPIAWDIEPWPLFRGVMHIRVRSGVGAASPRGMVALDANGITLRDADVTIPAAAIGTALGDMTMGSVDGEVNASTANLVLAPGSNSGEARLVWRNARFGGMGGATPLDLGEVRATLIANGAAMSGPLTNDGGSLGLRGNWSLREKDSFALALRVTPRRADQVELTRWLSAIGTADGDGWRVTWQTPLR